MPADGSEEQDDDARRRRRLLWGLGVVALLAVAAAVLALTRPASGGTVTVPSVAGQSEAAAGATLRGAGLVPVPALSANASVPNGVVIGETPPAGSVVGKGTRVTFSVSAGPGSSALLNVVGLTASQATAKLKAAGFKPTTETQSSVSVASGRVISTDPPAGTELQAGSQVTVLVSGGPAQTTRPQCRRGDPVPRPKRRSPMPSSTVGTVTQRETTERSPGTVLEQSPSAESSLVDDGKVNLTIAQALKEVAVPEVKGAAQAAAAERARTRRVQAQGAAAVDQRTVTGRMKCWNRDRRVAPTPARERR